MLQNRADPSGALHAVAARGLFTGNRGVIHDPETKRLSGRRWSTPAWISCSLSYKGYRRDVWGRNAPNDGVGWTELFFLDEVTALAAGHRPCFTCRRDDANRFRAAWVAGDAGEASATGMNSVLHAQRSLSRRAPPETLSAADLASLPDGAMVSFAGRFHALKGGRALPWSFNGYGAPQSLLDIAGGSVTLVSPRAVTAALTCGYRPLWHDTAA